VGAGLADGVAAACAGPESRAAQAAATAAASSRVRAC